MPPTQKKLSRAEAKAGTRKALIEAAAQVFADHGYEAASVDELAKAAGYTVGALYAHFPGKEALFLAVIEAEVAEARRHRRGLLASAPDMEGEIDALARDLDAATPDARRSTLLFQEFWLYAARHAERRPELAAGYRAWQDGFFKVIADRWIPEAAAGDISTAARTAMILALSDGLARQSLLSPDLATGKTLADGIRLLLARPPGDDAG